MSAASNFVTHFGGYGEIAITNTTLCPPDEAILRKPQRVQSSFVEKIP